MAQVSASLQGAFERFWAAYPKRPWNPRAATLAKFVKLVKAGVDPEALIGAAGVFAASCQTRGIAADFIPYASTWLSKRQDLDFPASPPAAASPDGPDALHPGSAPDLAFLRLIMSDGDFAVWIAPLKVEAPDEGRAATITAKTTFALDRVRKDWGDEITARLGPVDWTVERKPT